ncbi:MAG: hypothetical protein HY660_14630 [Armatimonadetes bacterium]|nr:hypothetical protein [Armatimonadota bacterium]
MNRAMSLLLLFVVIGVALGTSLAYAGEDLSGEDPPMSAAGNAHNNAGKVSGTSTPGGHAPNENATLGGNPGNKAGDRDQGGR